MMNFLSTFSGVSGARLERNIQGRLSIFVFSSGEPKVRPGGLGAEGNQVFYGMGYPIPCLRTPKLPDRNTTTTQIQTKEQKMNKTKNLMYQTTPNKLTQLLLIASLLNLTIFASACSTSCHRRDATIHVLDQENALLHALETERKSSAIRTKVSSDPALSKAESHLNQAFQSLLESNEAVKAAL